jgi:hypothetical protein
MQAEQSDKPASKLPVPHTKARAPAISDKRQRIGTKLQAALTELVWNGKDIASAAHAAGLTGHAVRCALAKPHVIRALREERDVFTAYARAGNIHALLDVRENSKNDNARVAAAKVIEHRVDEPGTGTSSAMPGITIVIGNTDNTLQSQAKLIDGQAVEVSSQPVTVSVGPIGNGTE